jgi:hypothetical protein
MAPSVVVAALLCLGLAACGGGAHPVAQAPSPSPPGVPAGSSTEAHRAGTKSRSAITIADGLPHVSLPPGALALSDGDADNPKDTDGNGDVDPGADTDQDGRTRASYDAPDSDDAFTLELGRGAGTAQARELSRLVTRYFAAARAEDAASACSMLLPSEAESVSVGPSRKSGETCQSAGAVLLKQFHHRLADAIKVVDVRIVGEAAEVVFGSRTMPASYVLLKRYRGSWKLDGLLATRLP